MLFRSGTLVFMISAIVHFLISKYAFNVDLIEELVLVFNTSMDAQQSVLDTVTGSELLDVSNVSDMFRNLIAAILFFRSMIVALVTFIVELFILKRIKYIGAKSVKISEFYLPGNAILVSFGLYLVMMILTVMDTPLYAEPIFLNLQVIFNFMFIVQGIAVCIYYARKWSQNGLNSKLVIGALCIGIFGFMIVSFIGMIDSVLDFRQVRVCKSA